MFTPVGVLAVRLQPLRLLPVGLQPQRLQPVGLLAVGLQPERLQPEEIAQAFSSAQTRSIIGVSATQGTADELVVVNTWNDTGRFYVRVCGRDGAFDTGSPFTVNVTRRASRAARRRPTRRCAARDRRSEPALATVILTDSSKVSLTAPLPGGGTLARQADDARRPTRGRRRRRRRRAATPRVAA